MAWQYHDYEAKSTPAAKLAWLELHIAEVSAEIGPDLSESGRSRSNGSAVQYLAQLRERHSELSRSVRATSSGFTRGRCL